MLAECEKCMDGLEAELNQLRMPLGGSPRTVRLSSNQTVMLRLLSIPVPQRSTRSGGGIRVTVTRDVTLISLPWEDSVDILGHCHVSW
jgi:hypothetical protein